MNKLVEVFSGMRRNFAMTLASLILIFLTISVLGGMVLLSSNTTKTSQDIVSSLQMHVYVDSSATESQIDTIKQEIENNPSTGKLTFSSKEEQLDMIASSMTDDDELIKKYFSGDANPLNSVFYINPTSEEVSMDTFQKELQTIENVESVDYGKDQGADELISTMNLIKFISFAIVLVLTLVTIFLIINTIKLTIDSRKKEIEIMRLVGATKSYITFPFLLEGLILGLIGGTFSFVMTDFLYNTLYNSNGAFLKTILINPGEVIMILLITQVAFAILIGGISSLVAIRTYLKV